MLARQTIIALRARHQAYRIASDILYPHVDVPPPPAPVIPPIEGPIFLPPRVRRKATRASIVLAAVVWFLILAFWLAQWLAKRGTL